jgi:hypothetical protein
MNAVVVQFPEKVRRIAKRRLERVELDARWHWMLSNASKWETVRTDGAEYPSWHAQQLFMLLEKEDGVKPATMAEKRKRIAEDRKLIEKRNRVKAWLESLGADVGALGQFNPAEKALFFVFDQMHERELPPSF